MKTYDTLIKDIDKTKNDEELAKVYDENDTLKDGIEKESLKLKIAKKSEDFKKNVEIIDIPEKKKENDEIKISKKQIKKIGVITMFGVAILATGIALGKKSSSNNISATAVPFESSASMDVTENVDESINNTEENETEEIVETEISISDGSNITVDKRDLFLNEYPQMTKDMFDQYNKLPETSKNFYRFINETGTTGLLTLLIDMVSSDKSTFEDLPFLFNITELYEDCPDIYAKYQDKLPDTNWSETTETQDVSSSRL